MFAKSSRNIAVFGIYTTPHQAERAVDRLLAAGFSHGDLSVLLPDESAAGTLVHRIHTKAPEGAATGVTAGGVFGGVLGLLAGVGALAIPAAGPLLAAGPILSALAGLGFGGAVGGIVGALAGMGIPELEAKRYAGRVRNGGVLLAVHCDTDPELEAAEDALRATGAQDIAATEESPLPEAA